MSVPRPCVRVVAARFVALLAVTVLTGCDAAGGGRATAERFLDAHYVHIDLATARGLCAGLAGEKLDKEIALTEEISIADDTRAPRVNYRLETARESEERAQFAYVLTIRAPGLEPFDKLVTLTVRRQEGRWSVTNYTEGDRGEGRANAP